jgi:hypothetical protein
MGCALCADFCRDLCIVRSIDLEAVLADTLRAIKDRRLTIDCGGLARDDYVECDLSCEACGQRFELRCETYHGSGGTWKAV